MRHVAIIACNVIIVLSMALFAACGGAQKKTATQIETQTEQQLTPQQTEEEDLTERKVTKPKEPEFVPGIAEDAQIAFKKGVRAISSVPADYATAQAAFEEAVSKDKTFMEAWFNLGMTYERIGKPEEAIKVYQRALAANPGNLDAQAYVGKVYLSLAKRERDAGETAKADQYESEAKNIFDQIIAKDPDNITANNAMALYFLYRGDMKTSEDYVKKVLMVQPRNVVALNTRGLINLLAGKLNIARWVFEEKALAEDPNSTEAWTNLGLTYLKMGKVPHAVAAFEKAVTSNPDNAEARLNLAAIYLEYLHYKAALEQYDAVLKLVPNNVEALIGRGSCLEGLHEPKEAIASWEKAVQLDPDRGVLWARIGRLYEMSLNDLDKAIAAYEKYIETMKPGPNDSIVAKLPALKQMRNAPKAPEPSPEQGSGQGQEAPQSETDTNVEK